MGLRIICIFVILFIGTNAQTVQYGDDNYKHMLEMIIDLQSTVTNLESTVTNLRLTEIKLQGVVSKQTTELENMEEKVEKLESTVTNLESNVTKLESTVTNLESTETNLESTVTNLESTMTKLESTETNLESTMTKLESTMTNLESTVTNLESTETNLESTMTNLESTVTNLESTVTNIESTETNLESTVTNLEGVVSKQTTYLEYMEEKVENLEEKQLEMEAIYPLPTSCKSISQLGYEDGVYTIRVNNSPLQVYCHIGWTVIQKRYDGSLDYNRTFDQYAHGFGSPAAEHWIGLNHMHELTSTGNWTLRFDLTAFNGETAWAEYDDFRIDPGTDFTLWFDQLSYRGTAGSSLGYNGGRKFSTTDMDQDDYSGNCADRYGGGGWWFGDCSTALTTGMSYGEGRPIIWYFWKGFEVLKSATMKIIPN